MHFSKDHLGTESDRNRTRALKSQLFLVLSVVTGLVAPLRTCARLKAAAMQAISPRILGSNGLHRDGVIVMARLSLPGHSEAATI